jgi:hypothetical protein
VSVTNLVNTDANEPETVRTDNVPAVQPPRDSQLLRQAGHPFLVFRHRIHHERNRLQARVLRRRGSALKRIVPHLDAHVAIIVVHASVRSTSMITFVQRSKDGPRLASKMSLCLKYTAPARLARKMSIPSS